jgi:hypothetical protein
MGKGAVSRLEGQDYIDMPKCGTEGSDDGHQPQKPSELDLQSQDGRPIQDQTQSGRQH